MIAIGADVGGTQTRAAAVDRTGKILARYCRRTDEADGADRVVTWLVGAIENTRDEVGIGSSVEIRLGVALPGTLDQQRRTVVRSINLPFLEGYPFIDELARRTRCPTILYTDAEAATWGEYVSCAPRPGRFVHLRLGTGIACGVVVEGRLQRLDAGRSEHLDALIIDNTAGARPCPCGRRGCLETVASGRALEERAREVGYANGIADLRQAWEQGDDTAVALLQKVTDTLMAALRNLATHFQPGVICLGGGVVTGLPCLPDRTMARLQAVRDEDSKTEVSVVPARLGDDAGLIGAALLAMDRS
ncbi:MAG: ROK family protein [Phycisphaerales bacterium]|nr:MAG: ROK family protein [Phycisphaerales bacterium]